MADIEGAVAHPAHKAIQGFHTILGDWGMMAYLGYMAKRLAVVRSKMKDTGSIYLHCDPTASHYLKILMDSVFGADNFRNEIIWHYKGAAMTAAKKAFPKKHDTILFYSKSDKYTFNPQREEELSEEMKKRWESYLESDNKSILWGRIKNEPGQVRKHRARLKKKFGREPKDSDVAWTANPSLIRSVWTDLPEVRNNPRYKESLGYPTQKPLALLYRIIQASSNPDDLVLDPFCGCGTTIAAAEELGRRWIGIDISAATIRIVTKSRPELQMAEYEIFGIPKGMEEARRLASMNRLQYEHWAISTIPGLAPNDRRNQEGFDGIGAFNAPMPGWPGKVERQTVTAEVKSSKGGVTAAQRSHLKNHTKSNKSELGIFITLERDQATEKWCRQQGDYQMPGAAVKYPKFQVFSAEQYFAGEKPDLPTLLDPMTGKPTQIELAPS